MMILNGLFRLVNSVLKVKTLSVYTVWLVLVTLMVIPEILDAGFTNVTADAFPGTPAGSYSVAWVDINNDGLQDVYIAPYVFYINNGDGTFTERERTDFAEFPISGNSRASFADANNNGYIDMVITDHAHTTAETQRYSYYFENSGPPNYRFTGQIIYTLPLNIKGGQPMFVDIDGDGMMEIYLATFGNWAPNYAVGMDQLFKRNAQGGWNNITADHIPQLTNASYHRPSRGVNHCDFDMDFDMDIFVPVYTVGSTNAANFLWVNDGNGFFVDGSDAAGVAIEPHGRYAIGLASGAAFGDFTNDGWFDLAVANIHGWAAIYENNKDGTFTNVTDGSGLFTFSGGEKQWHNADWIDHNNNGYLDLWLTQWYGDQGFVCYVYENQGPENIGKFIDVTEQLGFNKLQEFNDIHGLAAGDYDGDGFLDILFHTRAGYNTQYRGNYLFRNNGNDNNWLQIDLVGNGENVNLLPIGSQARIFYKGGTGSYIKQVESVASDQSMHQHRLHFGLGKQEDIQEIMVRWQDGRIEYWLGDDIGGVNQIITLTYGTGSTASTMIFVDADFTGTADGSSYAPHSTIRAAISQAVSGNLISVKPGWYMENITFQGKDIRIVAAGKAEDTVLISATPGLSNVIFNGGESNNAVLEGFKITSGWGQNLYGGAISCINSSPTIINCEIILNQSNSRGGGILLVNSEAKIIGCTITNNEAPQGAAIYAEQSDVSIMQSVIQSNSADRGGAIKSIDSHIKIINTLISGNISEEGGVIDMAEGSLNMEFCTVTDNNTGLLLSGTPEQSGWSILNSILYDNGTFDLSYDTTPNVRYTNTTNPISGEGNISGNPNFNHPEGKDWRLSPFSPCIGAALQTDVNVDITGAERPQPADSVPDMGCYENERASAAPGMIYVATTGSNDSGDGTLSNPYATINYSLANSIGGETIVVAPGLYIENIVFSGKPSRIVSYYETTGAKRYIYETVIDGGGNNPVIRFVNNETQRSEVKGFTLQNGTFPNGGGIHILGANPTLSNLIITDCAATTSGGGIFMQDAQPVIRDVMLRSNTANNFGGGMAVVNSRPTLDRIDVHQNVVNNNGGGIAFMNSNVVGRHFTLAENIAIGASPRSGGILSISSNIHLVNSILWGNSPEQTAIVSSGSIGIYYSNVEGGYEGEGNINTNPLFLSANDRDYRLQENSPCINAGIARFSVHNNELINLSAGSYSGNAPDMGAYDFYFADVDETVLPRPELNLTIAPNPFNPNTNISFSIAKEGMTSLRIYNIKGQRVAELLNDRVAAGKHNILWEGRDYNNRSLASGVYLIKLDNGGASITSKVILLK